MATAILQPHDCLRNQFGQTTIHSANTNPRTTRSRRRKRSPTTSKRETPSTSPPKSGLVMGQVKILKRGEELKPEMFSGNNSTNLGLELGLGLGLELCSVDHLGPEPETVKKQIRVPDLYAAVSPPPPSSLPFPTAFVCRTIMETDLRKLLRI